ncbi:MAG: tetratricopeptide repeat protein [Minisyncoccales bacterium]
MSKKYQIFFLIALILFIAGAGFFLYQKYQPASEENEIFSLPERITLTEKQQEKFDKAKADLKENPNDYLALIAIAQVKYQVQDLDGAEKVYLMALEIQPTNTLILNNLGDIYNQKKEYQKASEMYLKIIESNPKWINAYRELAAIYKYHLKDRYPEMEVILLKGLEKSKEFTGEAPVDFYSMLAVFYKETGQVEKAIKYFEKVLELTPENQGAEIELEELKKLL